MGARLFRALVVFGASLTGAVASNACSSGVDPGAAGDASADGEYAKISPNYGNIYPKISPPPPPEKSDAGGDADASDVTDATDASDSG